MATTVWLDGEPSELVSAEASEGPGGGVRLELCWREAGLLRILLMEMPPGIAARIVAELGRELARVIGGNHE